MEQTRRILVVDDEPKVLYVLSAALKKLGAEYDVATAPNGRAALTRMEVEKFDLLITDLQMPGIDGTELTRKARAASPDLPVIWITAYGSPKVRAEGRRLGIYECLDKPIGIGEIRRVVLGALESSSARDARDMTQ